MADLRIGILGAARIAPSALIAPARHVDGVTVAAVAARERTRADAFARKHGIPRVLPDYQSVVDDPEIDAIYIPLPNGLHAEWIRAAIGAGKHVLCEKPFTSNSAQATEIAALAAPGLVVMDAFHYRYHPLAARMLEVIATLGEIEGVETAMCIPLLRFGDIRYNFDLGGGALMDTGCYAIHTARLFGPGEPVVTGAHATTLRKDRRIDRAMTIDLAYPNGATGRARSSMWSSSLLNISATVTGTRGTMKVLNYLALQYFHRLATRVDGRKHVEKVNGEASYTHQLRAFLAATRGEPTNLTPPQDAVRTMSLIDDAYRAASLPLRR